MKMEKEKKVKGPGRRREDGNEGREERKTSKHMLKTMAVYPMTHIGKHDTFQAI